MSETVTITPRTGNDRRGDPIPAGDPFDLKALEVVPGNTAIRYGIGADLSDVNFTVFLPLRAEGRVLDGYGIRVRELDLDVRVQVWKSGGRGAVIVLAHKATGESAVA